MESNYEAITYASGSKLKHNYKLVDPPEGVKPSPQRLRNIDYKGCVLPEMMYFPEMEKFQFDSRDIIVCGYPKSGNTWTIEIICQLLKDEDYIDPGHKNIIERCPLLEEVQRGFLRIQDRKPPRLLRSHLHYQAMPESFFKVKPKAVCVIRNPKDIIVSGFHFFKMINIEDSVSEQNLDEICLEFVHGTSSYGPYWRHVKGFWEQRNSGHVLCVFYEDLKQDFQGQVRKIAEFLGIKVSDARLEEMKTECSLQAMRENKSTNLKEQAILDFSKGQFYRKGTIGDWKSLLNEKQSHLIDQLVEKELKPLGIEFCYEV